MRFILRHMVFLFLNDLRSQNLGKFHYLAQDVPWRSPGLLLLNEYKINIFYNQVVKPKQEDHFFVDYTYVFTNCEHFFYK